MDHDGQIMYIACMLFCFCSQNLQKIHQGHLLPGEVGEVVLGPTAGGELEGPTSLLHVNVIYIIYLLV